MYVCMYIRIYVDMYICIYVYISTNYFNLCLTAQEIPCAWLGFCGHSRAVWQFSAGICNTIEDARHKVAKVTCFTVHFGVPARAARICQHYQGFVQVGRCGTGTVRSGQKVDGKIRYFRTEGCAASEREAGSVFGPATPIEDSRTSGAVARKRCVLAKMPTVKCVTFGPKVAPFPSVRRGPFPDPPSLSGEWDIGVWIACKIT